MPFRNRQYAGALCFVVFQSYKYTHIHDPNSSSLMPYTARAPLREIGIARLGKPTSLRERWVTYRSPLACLFLLPSLLLSAPGGLLPLLAVQNQKHERRRQAEDEETLEYGIVELVEPRISSRHRVIVHIVVEVIVVQEIVLYEVGYPLTDGPIFLRRCSFLPR